MLDKDLLGLAVNPCDQSVCIALDIEHSACAYRIRCRKCLPNVSNVFTYGMIPTSHFAKILLTSMLVLSSFQGRTLREQWRIARPTMRQMLSHTRRLLLVSFAVVFLLPLQGASSAALFTFRNGFWINLHHFLYAQALSESSTANARWISSAQDAIKKAQCADFESKDAAQTWEDATRFYTANYASRDMLRDREFAHYNDLLGDAGNVERLPTELPADLRTELEKAAPVYRQACWENHRKLNQAWIDSLEPLLAAHGAKIASRLTEIYETTWPAEPLPVDVVVYADWAGAYTVPPHITVGSVDEAGRSTELETIFHEALHTMDRRMVEDLGASFARNHSQAYDLDHVMIFFTAGFVTKQELSQSDPDYEPYAYREGMYKRVKYWDQDEAALRKYWQPFLEGKSTRTEALDRLTHAICCEPWPPPKE